MPPASLSTFAVMKPGPTTASNSAIRLRHSLNNVIAEWKVAATIAASVSERWQALGVGPRRKRKKSHASVAVPQHRDHVVGGDDAGEAAVLVDHRERDQVVFVEERRHFGL